MRAGLKSRTRGGAGVSEAAASESAKKQRFFARIFSREATSAPARLGAGHVSGTRARTWAGILAAPPPRAKKFCEQGPKTASPLACKIFSPMGICRKPGAVDLHRRRGPQLGGAGHCARFGHRAGAVSCAGAVPARPSGPQEGRSGADRRGQIHAGVLSLPSIRGPGGPQRTPGRCSCPSLWAGCSARHAGHGEGPGSPQEAHSGYLGAVHVLPRAGCPARHAGHREGPELPQEAHAIPTGQGCAVRLLPLTAARGCPWWR